MNKINNRHKIIYGCGLGLCLWAASLMPCSAAITHTAKWNQIIIDAPDESGWVEQGILVSSFGSGYTLGPKGVDYNFKWPLIALKGSDDDIIPCDTPDPNVGKIDGKYAYSLGNHLYVVPSITATFKRDELCDLKHHSAICGIGHTQTHSIGVIMDGSVGPAKIILNEDLIPHEEQGWNIPHGSYVASDKTPFCANFTKPDDDIGTIKNVWSGNINKYPVNNSIHIKLYIYSDGYVQEGPITGFKGLSLQLMSSDPEKSEIIPLLAPDTKVVIKHRSCSVEPNMVDIPFGSHNIGEDVSSAIPSHEMLTVSVHCDHNSDTPSTKSHPFWARLYRNPALPAGKEIKNELFVQQPNTPPGEGEKTLFYQAIIKDITKDKGGSYPNCDPNSHQQGLVDFKEQADNQSAYMYLFDTRDDLTDVNWAKFGIFWSLCGKSNISGARVTNVALDVFTE